MFAKIHSFCKPTSTMRTKVWFLTSVGALMCLEAVWCYEALPTILTYIWSFTFRTKNKILEYVSITIILILHERCLPSNIKTGVSPVTLPLPTQLWIISHLITVHFIFHFKANMSISSLHSKTISRFTTPLTTFGKTVKKFGMKVTPQTFYLIEVRRLI